LQSLLPWSCNDISAVIGGVWLWI